VRVRRIALIAITRSRSKLQTIADRNASGISGRSAGQSAAIFGAGRISAWSPAPPRWGSMSAGSSRRANHGARLRRRRAAGDIDNPGPSCSAQSWACSEIRGRDKVTIMPRPGSRIWGLARAAAGVNRPQQAGPHPGRRRAARERGPVMVKPLVRLSAADRRDADPNRIKPPPPWSQARHPVVRHRRHERYHIGQELPLEIATRSRERSWASNPFDSPTSRPAR